MMLPRSRRQRKRRRRSSTDNDRRWSNWGMKGMRPSKKKKLSHLSPLSEFLCFFGFGMEVSDTRARSVDRKEGKKTSVVGRAWSETDAREAALFNGGNKSFFFTFLKK